jgi:hypothetical protein
MNVQGDARFLRKRQEKVRDHLGAECPNRAALQAKIDDGHPAPAQVD